MSGPPRTQRGGAAMHTSATVTSGTFMCGPHTARTWRIDFPAGSDITIKLPLADLSGPRGRLLKILNDGGVAITVELRPGITPLTLSLPIDHIAIFAITNDPDILPAAGQEPAEAVRWAAIVHEVGARSGLGLLVAP